jgi:hypothetical protein
MLDLNIKASSDAGQTFSNLRGKSFGDWTFRLSVFLVGLLIVIAGALATFPHIASSLLFSWDSATYVTNSKEYFDDGTISGLIASYSQSYGNLAYTLNFNLFPEARFAYFGGQLHPVIMYLVASALFFTATFLMASEVFGFSVTIALLSGLVMVAFTMPFTSPPMYSEIFWWHSPYAIPLVYASALVVLTVHFVGRFGVIGNVLVLAALSVEVLWIIVGNAKGGVILLIAAGLLCVPLVTTADTRQMLGWKMLGAMLVVTIILLPGPLAYIRGLYTYTSTTMAFSDATTDFKVGAFLQTAFPSLNLTYFLETGRIWANYQLGYPLTIFSIAGLLHTAVWPPTRLARHAAITLMVMLPMLVFFSYGMTIGSTIYPIFVIFAVVGFLAAARWVFSKTSLAVDRQRMGIAKWRTKLLAGGWPTIAAIVLGAALFILFARVTQRTPAGWRYPPSRPPLIELLASQVRFRSGDIFRGRYLDMSITMPLEKKSVPNSSPLAYGMMVSAFDHAVKTGNDLTLQGPRYYDIPVAAEGNRMNTPASALFHSVLLVNSGDRERIDYRIITHFNERLFRLLGIRYVLSHRALDGAKLLDVAQLPEGTALYEIREPNTGQYSPTEIAIAPQWREALERIATSDFDPQRTAIVRDAWIGGAPLVTGKAEITRTNRGYRIIAHSPGRSLVILPFEFSRCLIATERQGTAKIGRADFFLTGMLFEKDVDVEIQLRFGPFENSGCRLADLQDTQAMGIGPASLAEARQKYPQRFLYEGRY